MTLVEQYRTRGNEQAVVARPMSGWVAIGWLIAFAGFIIWLYGYFSLGHPPFIDWYSIVPFSVLRFFHNVECEIGMAFSIGGMMLIFWPHLR